MWVIFKYQFTRGIYDTIEAHLGPATFRPCYPWVLSLFYFQGCYLTFEHRRCRSSLIDRHFNYQPIVALVIEKQQTERVLHHQLSMTSFAVYFLSINTRDSSSLFIDEPRWHRAAPPPQHPAITPNGNGKVIKVSGSNIHWTSNKISRAPSMRERKR